jgi:predicted permease
VGQVALSLILLVGAGVLLRGLWAVQAVAPGFDPREVVTAQISPPADRIRTREDADRFWSELLGQVRAIPGVERAAATSLLPLVGEGDTYYYVEGRPPASTADKRAAQINVATDDYFATMRIPIVAGRALGANDRAAGSASIPEASIVISRGVARALFPRGDAVGSRLVVELGAAIHAQIVGIAGDVRAFGQQEAAPDILYLSLRQMPGPGAYQGGRMSLAVRANAPGLSLVAPIRGALRRAAPGVPLANVATLSDLLRNAIAPSAFRGRVLAAFALTALALAVLGLYGVVAYSVTQRTRELGLRLALGARRGEVLRLVVTKGMRLVLIGIVLGVLGTAGAMRVAGAAIPNIAGNDPFVLVAVIALLVAGGLAACVIPARRATRISPIVALRQG